MNIGSLWKRERPSPPQTIKKALSRQGVQATDSIPLFYSPMKGGKSNVTPEKDSPSDRFQ